MPRRKEIHQNHSEKKFLTPTTVMIGLFAIVLGAGLISTFLPSQKGDTTTLSEATQVIGTSIARIQGTATARAENGISDNVPELLKDSSVGISLFMNDENGVRTNTQNNCSGTVIAVGHIQGEGIINGTPDTQMHTYPIWFVLSESHCIGDQTSRHGTLKTPDNIIHPIAYLDGALLDAKKNPKDDYPIIMALVGVEGDELSGITPTGVTAIGTDHPLEPGEVIASCAYSDATAQQMYCATTVVSAIDTNVNMFAVEDASAPGGSGQGFGDQNSVQGIYEGTIILPETMGGHDVLGEGIVTSLDRALQPDIARYIQTVLAEHQGK